MPNKGVVINRNARSTKSSSSSSKFNQNQHNWKRKAETKQTNFNSSNLENEDSEEEIKITFNISQDEIKGLKSANELNHSSLENVQSVEVVNYDDPLLLIEKNYQNSEKQISSSIDGNASGGGIESQSQSSNDSLKSKESLVSENRILKDALSKMKNRGKARKGFARATNSLTQQAQAKMIRSLKATSMGKSNDSHCVDQLKMVSNRKARKSFNGHKNYTPSVSANTEVATREQEERLSNGDLSSSVKKKKRSYYKGHTYGLFLSRKKRRRRKDPEVDDEEDESIQSGHLNQSGSDEELQDSSSVDDRVSNKLRGKGYPSSSSEISIKDSESKLSINISTRLDRRRKLNNTTRTKKNEREIGIMNDDSQGSSLPDSINDKSKVKQKMKRSDTTLTNSNQNELEKPKPSRKLYYFNKSADLESLKKENKKILLRIDSSGSVHSFTEEINLNETKCSNSKKAQISSADLEKQDVCCCGSKPSFDGAKSFKQSMFCQAIDCFDGKLIGCCNVARLPSLFRASIKVPYQIYCEVHLARLRRHHCCPGCGLFCTQGQFLECFAVKKQVHLFHKACQTVHNLGPNVQLCPHCAKTSEVNVVRLEMNGPIKESCYYLSQTPLLKMPRARITINRLKELSGLIESSYVDKGIEISLPQTKKVISLSGLPYGPDRKQLENLLTSLSTEKPALGIRFLNKNFYGVAKSGEVDKVLNLLAQGFDPNYSFEEHNNETPLHAAASGDHLMAVHVLIQTGANINALNQNILTPLMLAIEGKHHAVMRYLIRAGADHEIKSEDGMTALHIAAKCGNLEAVVELINNRKINLNLQDDGGWTALVWATEHKHISIVKFLLSNKADPHIQDDEENIGIHWACYSGDVNIAYIYLELGSDINAINIHGDTPLHIAARRDNYDCVVLLLSRAADFTLLNKNEQTAIMCAPKGSQTAMALKINTELRRFDPIRKINSDKILDRDVSKGKEFYQIPIVNGYDSELPPADYMYITENCETSSINIDRTISSLQNCDCKDECVSENCICATISLRCWYDREGKLSPDFNLADPPMIFECNRACSCWKTCYNRVVQFGIRVRLQVFRTKGKGWGVRPLKDIPKGTFVCEYIGDIITDFEADRREDDSYLFDLDNRDGETYCLDARFYGNVSRFINHLCEPNLIPVKVFVDHQDLSFPRIALFANKDIKAFEELGFDYGEKFWVIKYRWFTCDCSSLNCKYSKDVIHQTLNNYYRRMREDHSSKDGSEDNSSH